ncbi:hypothetical protein C4D60_Mb09t09560 [Musa balbisiana]|uniref:Uncharacterized protein n=1 Tax=Musa balbisiana TaxID=52838 RepID=A0A4S8IF67_MUSBA|nr:hypothetical protein C4D60_Mb09t09560 [Musa balbisiana]
MVRKKTRRGASPLPPPTMPKTAAKATMAPVPSARRQPVILKQPAQPRARCAEMAGGTAADCLAVCCCPPLALVNLLVVASVRLPAGLCRRAARARARRKERIRRRKEAALLAHKAGGGEERASSATTAEGEANGEGFRGSASAAGGPSREEVAEMENMWTQFSNMGFWRSPSQREDRR